MKVYVIIPAYSYEGYADPMAAFATLSEAQAYLASLTRPQGDWRDVFELTLGDPTVSAVEVASDYGKKR